MTDATTLIGLRDKSYADYRQLQRDLADIPMNDDRRYDLEIELQKILRKFNSVCDQISQRCIVD